MREVIEHRPLCYGADWLELSVVEQAALLPLRRAHLAMAGLPADYDDLGNRMQKNARKEVLESWFDIAHPDELCCNVEALIRAFYLWVEFYEKAASDGKGIYYYRDPKTKYDMIRCVMSPARVRTEVAKTALHAPRGTAKTASLIRQLLKMIAIVRPYSSLLLSEINQDRTEEEIAFVKGDIENNELIHADFGGEGVLWPGKADSGLSWTRKELEFKHHRLNRLAGYSMGSKMRGRHPIMWIGDDLEDEITLRDKKHRKKLIGFLFATVMGMMFRGGKMIMVGTTLHGSILSIALKEGNKVFGSDSDEVAELLDTKFQDWNKFKIGMIRTDPATGKRESIMPDKMTVEGYDNAIRARGAVTVSGEMDGEPLAQGVYALQRDPARHGYLHGEDKDGEFFLDLHTDQRMPWKEWLDTLYITQGTDIADSVIGDGDLGCCVCVGTDPVGKVFALDCEARRCISDEWPEHTLNMGELWGSSRAGFETGTNQKTTLRLACTKAREAEDAGRLVPAPVPISNAGRNKHIRVLASLRPLYRNAKIAFPVLHEVTVLGQVMKAVPVSDVYRDSFAELYRELDTYTDGGPIGGDDCADALQMAIRTAGGMRGKVGEPADPRDKIHKKWDKLGMSFPASVIPESLWTDEMKESVDSEPVADNISTGKGERFRDDPYDG